MTPTLRMIRIVIIIVFAGVTFVAVNALLSNALLVKDLRATIRARENTIAKLKKAQKEELDMRDTQFEILKNKITLDEKNREIDKIVLDFIVAEQARISKRQEEIMGGAK
ncbi:MAG: hypothetical protein WC891_02870 [Actinomycetota bacterium]